MSAIPTLESVQQYYGKVLSSTKDLQTSACCTTEALPAHFRPLLADIHEEVQNKFYGCGSPIPSELEGCTVLDLGSGSGRDCYLLSRLVGERGRVIGVDMTVEQLTVAAIKGFPLSTTHVSTGAILGAGATRKSAIDWRTVRGLLLAWIVTVPAAAGLGMIAYGAVRALS